MPEDQYWPDVNYFLQRCLETISSILIKHTSLCSVKGPLFHLTVAPSCSFKSVNARQEEYLRGRMAETTTVTSRGTTTSASLPRQPRENSPQSHVKMAPGFQNTANHSDSQTFEEAVPSSSFGSELKLLLGDGDGEY